MLESIIMPGMFPPLGFAGHMHRYRFFYLAPDEGGGRRARGPPPLHSMAERGKRGCVSGHGFCFLKLIPKLNHTANLPGLAGRFIK